MREFDNEQKPRRKNQVEIDVRVGFDAREARQTKGGKAVNDVIASYIAGKKFDGSTDYVDVKVVGWEAMAARLESLKKGDFVTIRGRLGGLDTYKEKTRITIVADEVLLKAEASKTPPPRQPEPSTDEEFPF